METEMDVSFNEVLNSAVSEDPEEVSKEDRIGINNGGESFFAGLIKKSFKDFSRSNQSVETGRSNVCVNGQPISDRVVQKAEKKAGPIQSGNYWYDYRAGFWGVMGQPCAGIIPPLIEELNYPMPENCAAGNTGVFVNGRELHEKDLDLLAGNTGIADKCSATAVKRFTKLLTNWTGSEGYCVEIGDGVWDSWFMPLLEQTTIACEKVKKISELSEGYNIVGLSQLLGLERR